MASPVALPFGAQFGQGACLGLIGGAAADPVLTLTMTLNSATGFKGYFTYFSGDRTYSGLAVNALTANAATTFPTAAQLKAALAATVPPWAGNFDLTGTGSGPFSIPFINLLAKRRYGGTLTFTVTSSTGGTPTGAVTIATAGSAGAGQYDLYANGGTPNRVDAFLMDSLALSPVGGISGLGFSNTGQPANGYRAWTKGIFYADSTNLPEKSVLVGSGPGLLDANALTITPYKLVMHSGTSLTDAGAMIELL